MIAYEVDTYANALDGEPEHILSFITDIDENLDETEVALAVWERAEWVMSRDGHGALVDYDYRRATPDEGDDAGRVDDK